MRLHNEGHVGSENLPINHTEAWAAVEANRQLRARRRAAERDFNDSGCAPLCSLAWQPLLVL